MSITLCLFSLGLTPTKTHIQFIRDERHHDCICKEQGRLPGCLPFHSMPFNGKYSSSAISCSPRPRHHVPDYYQSRMEHRPAGVSACNVPFRIISDSNDDDNNKCQRSEIGIGAIKANERTESIGVKESAILVQPSFRLPILHLC